jgi:hypothetical protein
MLAALGSVFQFPRDFPPAMKTVSKTTGDKAKQVLQGQNKF